MRTQLLKEQLREILTQLHIKSSISESVQEQILDYLALLTQWNQTYNLTAVRDPKAMLVRHIADSLAVIPYLKQYHTAGHRFLDVGSGAGLPGIPLALALPDWQWTLLDSHGKKTRFLIHVKAALDLKNVEVIQQRVETFRPTACFQGVIARAWAALDVMLAKTRHLYCPDGRLWAMKGAVPQDELQDLQYPFTVYSLQVPGLNEQRHLVSITCIR